MSTNSFIEMELMFENDKKNTSKDFFHCSQDSLDISEISKSKFSEPYHIYCNKCNRVQVIKFISKNKLELICECKESPKETTIKECFNYLYYSDKIDKENEKLKCYLHPEEKYSLYCENCKKNICTKCADDCIDHKDKIKVFALDKDTIYKRKYIWDKIKEKNKFYIDNLEFENEYDCDISKYKLIPKKNDSS